MIEDECFKNDSKIKICKFYDSKRDAFIEIAEEILKGESWKGLDLASLGHLGPSCGHLGAILWPSWAISGPS